MSVRVELANLGKIGEEDVPPEFWHVASKMMPGDISEPVRTRLGLHVIKLVSANFTPTEDKVRSQIIKALKDEHAREVADTYRQNLYDEFGIKIVGKVPAVHLRPIRLRREGA